MKRSAGTGLFPVLLLVLLAGCDQGPGGEAIARYAAQATPSDPALAEIYERSCQACHSKGTSGAPLTGDEQAWNERMDKGMDSLLNNVVQGYGGMPPYGLCMDCNLQQFERLITFMASYPKREEGSDG